MAVAGRLFAQADVRAIYLLHGTFVGADALGILRGLSSVAPRAAAPFQHLGKQLADALVKDAGNYTPQYALAFESGIRGELQTRIPVRLFHWSGENHHLGRADAAVRLLDELAAQPELSGGRVLLWGHSHGGNVLALVSNLAAADAATRRRFFRAARPHYRWPLLGKLDLPVWPRLRRRLAARERGLDTIRLDMVTFGTPVRYGWDSSGYAKLLHFMNHRADVELAPDRVRFPAGMEDLLTAAQGDYIQHLGVAGTNLPPPLWAWRARLADVRLNRVLQAGIGSWDLLPRWKQGLRAHDEGLNLLVDYGQPEGHIGQHLAGHAVYTRLEWLPFHANEVARRFYDAAATA